MKKSWAVESEAVLSIIQSTPGLKAGEIRARVKEKYNLDINAVQLGSILSVLYDNNRIKKEGVGHNMVYAPKQEGEPPNEKRKKPDTTALAKPDKPTPFVHIIEIPRATLKLLVQAHIDADTPLEGTFGKAMLCAMKKLI